MIIGYDDTIHAEILFEHQHIDDDSHNEFYVALLTIEDMLKRDMPLKKIKKYIHNTNINRQLQAKLEELIAFQSEVISDKEIVKMGALAYGIHTLAESIKQREDATKKHLMRYAGTAREEIRAGKEIKEIIDNELRKYKESIAAFYRTQAKAAREEAYKERDKQLSKKIRGWISVAVLDNRTSAQCVALHNEFYLKKDYPTRGDIPNTPPRHPNCRSILMTVWENTRITDYKGQKLETFFKNNPEAAEAIMGKRKYRMWKSGKAKVKSYIDIKGKRFYRNDEIIQRLGIKSKKRMEKIDG